MASYYKATECLVAGQELISADLVSFGCY